MNDVKLNVFNNTIQLFEDGASMDEKRVQIMEKAAQFANGKVEPAELKMIPHGMTMGSKGRQVAGSIGAVLSTFITNSKPEQT